MKDKLITKKKVLIVEDSSNVRFSIETLIKDFTQIIGYAETSDDAIELICRLKPDIVILDISLKEGNGFEVLKEKNKACEYPLIIVLTNFSFSVFRNKCQELGADYFLDKTNEFEKILDVIR